MDALTSALANGPGGSLGIEVTLVEAEAHMGGRAGSRPLDSDAHVEHPNAPWGTHTPHGMHFVWGSYTHLLELLGGTSVLSPPVGTSTYCAWMAPPDLPGGLVTPARVVAVHVCDPSKPDLAWQPAARRILRAFARRGAVVAAFERIMKEVLSLDVEVSALLSYMDIVFAEDDLGAELRWILFMTGALSGGLGEPERSPLLKAILGGRRPSDVDIGELTKPLFADHVLPRLEGVTRFGPLSRLCESVANGADKVESLAAMLGALPAIGPIIAWGGERMEDLHALADFLLLLGADAARIVAGAASYDPRASGYLKNILKAAFSSPYGLDVDTSMRDAQFGVRRYEGAVLQLFDGDDSRAAWEAIAQRIETRFLPTGPLKGRIVRGKVASQIAFAAGKVNRVDLCDTPVRPPLAVPTVRSDSPGPTTETLPADVIISTLLPQALAPLLGTDVVAQSFSKRLGHLSKFMNETLNLQLFFPERHELPLTPLPAHAMETPPFGVSNLEGPFTIVVDLRRGFSKARFEAIRLDEIPNPAPPFDGTAWELVGAFSDLFVHDRFAHPGRYQWPLAVQQSLAALLCDPADLDLGTLDTRPWLHDSDAPNRLPPPPMGEVLPARRAAYALKWRERAEPLIVATTLEQLASTPGMAEHTQAYLRAQALHVLRGEPTAVRWVLTRNAQAHVRFFSAEPGLFEMRPHARFSPGVPGLYVAGDWTRNGLNLQAMEAATISGLQAAYGVIEAMRAAGLDGLEPPRIHPGIVPEGAWDVGYPDL